MMHPPPPPEEASAFEREIGRYRRYLSLLARIQMDRKLRGRMDPSDIVQQTMLEAFQARDQYQGEATGQRIAWLRRILARNLADAARDHGRARRDVALERSLEQSLGTSSARLGEWLAADQTSPSEHVARDEEVLDLVDALVGLADRDLDIIVARHWHGRALSEIAGELGTTRYEVTKSYREALERVRQLLESDRD
ncbi:MAG: sigma-70 family RNA polymerase sigma factor [Planctomycetes bacterium]|nr:sigma-70 family RNA polymerase sigma factor [Planctomycetota bacterium]